VGSATRSTPESAYKKVLVLCPPTGGVGGIERYIQALMEALQDLLGEQNVCGMALPETPRRRGAARLPAQLKWRFARRVLEEGGRFRPDLVVCTHLAFGPLGWLFQRLHGRPYWVILHGIEAWMRLPLWKRWALQKANQVMVVSAFTREQTVRRQGVAPEKIMRLPGVLNGELLKVTPAFDKLPRCLSGGRRIVLTVARMAAAERYKGHDVVLKALPAVIEQVPDVAYLVVGDGDDQPRLEAMANDLGLEKYVFFTGRVSEAELAACYRASRVFVMPARTVLDDRAPKGEGLGIAFLEAMAFGLPVIGPNCGAPSGFIRHEEHGLAVDPEDAHAVAQALTRLLHAPEERRRMGAAASRWVRQEYSYESFVERLRGALAKSATPT
jgi:phosphatidyl-myo-inositol dimannoside synthase